MHKTFEWDEKKDAENYKKHGVNFKTAQYAFLDPKRVIAEDLKHSKEESGSCIRIIGAGYWRKGKNIYEKQNEIQ